MKQSAGLELLPSNTVHYTFATFGWVLAMYADLYAANFFL